MRVRETSPVPGFATRFRPERLGRLGGGGVAYSAPSIPVSDGPLPHIPVPHLPEQQRQLCSPAQFGQLSRERFFALSRFVGVVVPCPTPGEQGAPFIFPASCDGFSTASAHRKALSG